MKHVLLLALTLLANLAFADLAKPTGEVLLTVEGAISLTNDDDVAEFDRDMLNKVKQRTIVTSNHVEKSPMTYKGPLLWEILNKVKASGSVARVYALDDYVAEISYDDIKKYQIILATHENGKQLTVKDKGPLFVVFPFDGFQELRQDGYYNQSVWQVVTVEVE